MEQQKTAMNQMLDFIKQNGTTNHLEIHKKIEELLYIEKQQLKKTYVSGFKKGSYYDNEIEHISEFYLESAFGIKRRI